MNITRRLLPILALSLLSSCASVSVKDERRVAKQPAQKPVRIYVADFRTDKGAYKAAGDAGKDLEAFKKKTADTLATYLVKGLDAHVAPAQRTSNTGALPKSGWLVTGDFVRVNTGSRVLRSGVGLGAGGTKMETKVMVYDLASGKDPFLTFETTGGSNAMPGLMTSTGPVSAALSMASQAMLGVTDDCARTSRMITGALNEYAVDRKWLPESKRYSAKKLGQYQLVHEQYSR
jgi:hypothetical protein